MNCIAINNIMKNSFISTLGKNIYFLNMLFLVFLICNKMTLQETTQSQIRYFVKISLYC